MTAPAHVLLVHGLWGGAWVWSSVGERLDAAGIPHTAVDLPLRAFDGDVAAVTAGLDAVTGPVVLVGHSYGGAVITAAGSHPSVRELAYVAAFQLDAGETVATVLGDRAFAPSEMDQVMRTMVRGGEVVPDAATIRPLLFNRTPGPVADAALARMRPVSTALFRGTPSEVAWRARRSTYVVCRDDRTVTPELQRAMAQRATRTVELDADHCPMDSAPDELAALLVGLAA
jgi:pimeloyl-ACP methyl ester carboxylesterase